MVHKLDKKLYNISLIFDNYQRCYYMVLQRANGFEARRSSLTITLCALNGSAYTDVG